MRRLGLLTGAVGFVCIFSISCVQTKNLTYFKDLPDTTVVLANIQPPRPIIEINDEIEIQLGGENEKTVEYIRHYFTTAATNTNGIEVVVDIDGNIELPKLGKIRISGLTREAARDTITNAYKEYLVDPIVLVKFGDFRFSVIGEVKAPGTFNVTGEKVNIFEALARAGDLTPYSKADAVKIIRDANGQRKIIPVNLQDKNLLNSSNYYLSRYDIVYVTPAVVKAVNQNIGQTLIYISAITSAIAIFVLVLKL
jgi:polysaccharide export outer membrane protein